MGTPRTRPGKYSECSLTPGEYCQQSVVSIELFVNCQIQNIKNWQQIQRQENILSFKTIQKSGPFVVPQSLSR